MVESNDSGSTAIAALKVYRGPRALALAAWLNESLGPTVRRTCTLLGCWKLRVTTDRTWQALTRLLATWTQRSLDAIVQLSPRLLLSPLVR